MNLPRPGAETPRADSQPASRWRRAAKWLGILAVVAAALTAGILTFARWQQHRLVENAMEMFRKGDLRSAWLMAGQAHQKNPKDDAACRVAAQVAEAERSPAAILWRQKVADLMPGEDAPLLDLATTATSFGETFIAQQALDRIGAPGRTSATFHVASAALAVAEKQFGAAEHHFQEALKSEPENERLNFNLAVLRVGMTDSAKSAAALGELEAFATKPAFRLEALRAMLTAARIRGDSTRALALISDIRANPGASLSDDLRLLDELQHAGSASLAGELRKLRDGARRHPAYVYALMSWMTANGRAAEAADWCAGLPAQLRSTMPVPLAEAEARTALADWKQLREIARDADWGDLEFLRHAILARVQFETDGARRRTDFRAVWERAMNSTRGNPNALVMLGRLVNGWGWRQEAAEAWWLAARNGTGQRAALKALFETYSAEKNTRELYRVARRVYEIEPGNPVAKNNVASLSLLLGEDLPEAHRLAAENHRLSPAQPVITATYAFSLHLQKRTGEAVAIMRPLPPAAMDDPSIAACYGVLLAERGDNSAARPFLEMADRKKAQLLPEEAAMVAHSLKGLP
jgi:Flp pilus assembly protein TadD